MRLSIVFFFVVLLSGLDAFASPNQPVEPRVTLEQNEGFCPNGAVVPLVPSADDPPRLNNWGGYCYVEQKKPVAARTSPFAAPKYLRIYMTGWSSSPALALQRVSDGAEFLLQPWDPSLYRWGSYDYRLPKDWRGKQVRLVAKETEKGFWRAFSEPLVGSGKVPLGDAIEILSLTSLHFVAIMVCALALAALAVKRGVRDTIGAGLVTLAGTALPGYCIFWLTLFSQRLGRYLAVLIIAAAFAGLTLTFRKLDKEGRAILQSLLVPLLLTGAAALLILSAGFLYGGRRDPMAAAALRFSHRLPNDNTLPFLLANGARGKHVPRPLSGDWLSSDRPPLQAAIVLSQFPLFHRPRELDRNSPGLGYETVGALLQSLWIFALWLLLTAFGLKSRLIVMALAACLFSGFIFVNTFFVWPKLLAATYAMGYLAAFVAPKPARNSVLQSSIVPGALLCFSVLSHGGIIFALIPMVLLVPLFAMPWENKRSWDFKRLCAVAAVAFVLYLPWTLYQKFYDPPGDRLLKTHLALFDGVDNRSFLETLKTSYGAMTFRQIVDFKYHNLSTAFGRGTPTLRGYADVIEALVLHGDARQAASNAVGLRSEAFFFIAASLGLFIVAPYALIAGVAKRFRSPAWRAACALWILTFTSIVFWSLVAFSHVGTVIPAGAYSTVILAMVASVLSLWAVSHVLALIVVLLQIMVNFLLYGPLVLIAYPDAPLPEGILHIDTLVLCVVSCAAVLVLFWKLARGNEIAQPPLPGGRGSASAEGV